MTASSDKVTLEAVARVRVAVALSGGYDMVSVWAADLRTILDALDRKETTDGE